METIDKKIISSEAAKTALIFGLISGGAIFLEQLMAGTASVFMNALSTLLWLVKLVGLIWLMKFFMSKLKSEYSEVDRKDIMLFGTLIALFSAIITGACSYISVEYVFSDQITTALDEVYRQLSGQLDSYTLDTMMKYEENIGVLSLISNTIWCFLYGTILSAILAPRIAPENIFDEQ